MLSQMAILLLFWPMQSGDAYREALTAYQAGRFADVVNLLESSRTEADPAAIHNLKALALAELKRYSEAVTSIRRARELAPGNARYAYNHGLILFEAREYAGARAVYNDAIQRLGESSSLLSALGETLLRLNEFDEAEKRLQRSLAIDPANASAWVIAARLYYSIGDQESFAKAAQTGFLLAPQNAQACYYHGLYLIEQAGRRADGAAQIRKSTELDSAFAEGFRTWGRILLEQKQWEEAVRSLERAVVIAPDDTQSLFLLSKVYRYIGQSDKADDVLERYLSLKRAQ
jgi:Tfp pilus assembly protein PilF